MNQIPPRMRRLARIAGYVCSAGLVLAGLGCVLRPYVGLYGGLTPQLNFHSRSKQYDAIEKARESDPKAATTSPGELARLLAEPSWPGYRGPNRDGVSTETGLAKNWPPEGPPELFRAPIGAGWAGFAIGLGRAYTIEQRRDDEVVACYSMTDGRELWSFHYPAAFSEQLGGDGPRSTPALEGARLYVLGAEGHLHCLDALAGTVIWKTNVLTDTGSENLHYGLAASPLVDGGRVWVTASGKDAPGLLAYDAETGAVLLKALPVKQGYSSLMFATLGGMRQLLNLAGTRLIGLDPSTGGELWSVPWETQNDLNIAQPVLAGPGRVFISSGYGKGCAMIEVRAVDGKPVGGILWSNLKMKNKFNSSVFVGGHIYGLDEGILACLDPATGGQIWKGGRLGHGQLLAADGMLIVMGEKGRLVLVNATPRGYEEKGAVQALTSKTWNTIGLAGGRLLVRNDREMVCYDLREGAKPVAGQ